LQKLKFHQLYRAVQRFHRMTLLKMPRGTILAVKTNIWFISGYKELFPGTRRPFSDVSQNSTWLKLGHSRSTNGQSSSAPEQVHGQVRVLEFRVSCYQTIKVSHGQNSVITCVQFSNIWASSKVKIQCFSIHHDQSSVNFR
jgi:hypothetical protein